MSINLLWILAVVLFPVAASLSVVFGDTEVVDISTNLTFNFGVMLCIQVINLTMKCVIRSDPLILSEYGCPTKYSLVLSVVGPAEPVLIVRLNSLLRDILPMTKSF